MSYFRRKIKYDALILEYHSRKTQIGQKKSKKQKTERSREKSKERNKAENPAAVTEPSQYKEICPRVSNIFITPKGKGG
jgi:hypothetical protein